MFKLNMNADACDTSLCGHVTTSYAKLAKLFGEAQMSDGYKVSGEWIFDDGNGGVFTVYDWKSTRLYDDCYPSVADFRKQRNVIFNIGGHMDSNCAYFQYWLLRKLGGK